jgi:broad specificity phosphatase PhoE
VSTLEIRRHSIRKTGGGSQLSQEGVDLARKVALTMGPFDRVVTSVVPRARETALAMGFAVDEELVMLTMDRRVYEDASRIRWWERPQPFAALAESLRTDGPYSRHAQSIAAVWRDLLTPLPPTGSVLMIGHSGDIEAALVACFPEADHESWGTLFGPCEGAKLIFEGDPARFSQVDLIRHKGGGLAQPSEEAPADDNERILGL